MPKKRASVKGKGIDILLGGSGEGNDPQSSASSTEATPSSIDLPLSDADAEAMAADAGSAGGATTPVEASAAPNVSEPNPFADSDPFADVPATSNPDPFVDVPATSNPDLFGDAGGASSSSELAGDVASPEDVATFGDTAGAFTQASEPAAVTPPSVSSIPVSAESAAPEGDIATDNPFEGEALFGQPSTPVSSPLPPETTAWLADETSSFPESSSGDTFGSSGPASVTLPSDPTLQKQPRIGGLLVDFQPIENAESFEPPIEGTRRGFTVAPVTKVTKKFSDDEIARRVGAQRVEALSKRIDQLYVKVAGGSITEPEESSDAMLLLRNARDKELEDPRQFDEAEYLVNVAEYKVTHSTQIRQWSYSYGIVIFIYGLIWLGLFAAGLVFDQLLLNWMRTFVPSIPDTATRMIDFFGPYETIIWGGVGGILGLLYSLYKHVAITRDFDRQFVIWYFIQPFMGILTGAIIHLFVVAGIFNLINTTGPAVQAFGSLAALSFAFRQNYLYAWIEALLKRLQPGGADASVQEAETKDTESIAESSSTTPSVEEQQLHQAQG